ncbi:MAG: rod shape-determining protein MreD [Spirochaetes bacterium GWF1_41_5]|nr:MAG: rod shape-determining protein MreD [Spirochaetes bacterium GWF1_41_5]HBE03997.1 rod shape-determining protein MreD [Spirochaetia bacterium]
MAGKITALLFLVLPLSFLQSSFFYSDIFSLGKVKLNLLFVCIFFLCLYRGFEFSLIAGIISGFILDLYSSSLFGLNMLVYFITGSIAGYYTKRIIFSRFSIVFVCFLCAQAAKELIILAYLYCSSGLSAAGGYLLNISLPEVLLNSAVFPVIYLLVLGYNRMRRLITGRD